LNFERSVRGYILYTVLSGNSAVINVLLKVVYAYACKLAFYPIGYFIPTLLYLRINPGRIAGRPARVVETGMPGFNSRIDLLSVFVHLL